MHKKIVILIQSDPRESHRPCEALRIALGLASSNHSVELILTPHATRLLEDHEEDIVDAEERSKYLPLLCEWIPSLFIFGEDIPAHPTYQTSLIGLGEIAQKIAAADSFMLF